MEEKMVDIVVILLGSLIAATLAGRLSGGRSIAEYVLAILGTFAFLSLLSHPGVWTEYHGSDLPFFLLMGLVTLTFVWFRRLWRKTDAGQLSKAPKSAQPASLVERQRLAAYANQVKAKERALVVEKQKLVNYRNQLKDYKQNLAAETARLERRSVDSADAARHVMAPQSVLSEQDRANFVSLERKAVEFGRQFAQGKVSRKEFLERMQTVTVQDQNGTWWAVTEKADWASWDGKRWVPAISPHRAERPAINSSAD